VCLAQQSGYLPTLRGIDHRQRLRLIPVESGDCLSRCHLRQQHMVGLMQDTSDRRCPSKFGRVRFRNDHHSGIAAVFIHSDNLVG
jgi:hypothetical protein